MQSQRNPLRPSLNYSNLCKRSSTKQIKSMRIFNSNTLSNLFKIRTWRKPSINCKNKSKCLHRRNEKPALLIHLFLQTSLEVKRLCSWLKVSRRKALKRISIRNSKSLRPIWKRKRFKEYRGVLILNWDLLSSSDQGKLKHILTSKPLLTLLSDLK